ncbi:MAG: anhydro-N-acetylmuramic acid kinase [Candidatus Scalindua sp. AMX11]|nr:MAG: anhydro-N-acetylmuramic acid kinase [Candidatus Scalindua sp.]NOG85416.1 anhydro-N-acetylmuramic acid kinase [Planctomycetota bacterium]RZV84047.1 MAG: anhydro-N-acetylmuramic acid kinase [Candidatus Scalindua sp. SCAELEC01]TDE65781.1 MAG: anhydro-N-acetylmuramic acid kinase [Candidatus Scalindua sp. AMX11]
MEKLIRLQSKNSRTVVGLMSGTSCDGIDACLIKIEGSGLTTKVDFIGFETYPYSDEIREMILRSSKRETGSVDLVCRLNFTLGKLFANSVRRIAEKISIPLSEIDLVGSHGHTVYHLPASKGIVNINEGSTLQIGEPSVIAQETGITTIADFRTRDIAVGGDGAPLVPYTDFILLGRDGVCRAIQNIGGIANVALLPGDCDINKVIAFDSGPGNMVIDRFAEKITNGRAKFDKDGALASRGRPDQHFLDRLCAHPFVTKQPPKSTGREDFGIDFADNLYEEMKQKRLNDSDAIATVTAFTAKSISDSYRNFIQPLHRIEEVVLGGGGVHNRTLMKFLGDYLPCMRIRQTDDFGIPADAKEAMSFALLANETVYGTPANIPSSTGAKEKVVLGKIILGS